MERGLVLGPTRLRLPRMLFVGLVLGRQVRQCSRRDDHIRSIRTCCSRSSGYLLFRTLVIRRALRNLQALIACNGVIIGRHGLLRGVHRVLPAHRVRVEQVQVGVHHHVPVGQLLEPIHLGRALLHIGVRTAQPNGLIQMQIGSFLRLLSLLLRSHFVYYLKLIKIKLL